MEIQVISIQRNHGSVLTTMTFSTHGNSPVNFSCKPWTRAIRVTCQRQQKPAGAILTMPPSTPANRMSPPRPWYLCDRVTTIASICSMSFSLHKRLSSRWYNVQSSTFNLNLFSGRGECFPQALVVLSTFYVELYSTLPSQAFALSSRLPHRSSPFPPGSSSVPSIPRTHP